MSVTYWISPIIYHHRKLSIDQPLHIVFQDIINRKQHCRNFKKIIFKEIYCHVASRIWNRYKILGGEDK